jgi:hypothetical protein
VCKAVVELPLRSGGPILPCLHSLGLIIERLTLVEEQDFVKVVLWYVPFVLLARSRHAFVEIDEVGGG